MNTKHTPATPLPWAWESVPHQQAKRIVSIDTGATVAAVIAEREDAIYLANCAMDYPQLVADRAALVEALRELVACKDMKDFLDEDGTKSAMDAVLTPGDRADRMAEYRKRKPLAWQLARALLARIGEE